MLRSQFTYYVIILGGGGGVRAMIILITQGGVGGPEMGKTWLRNMCTLPYMFALQVFIAFHNMQK